MAVINTNLSAMVAQNSLVKNERMMSKAMEQLSTGRRINSAGDDAAGMAIASKMNSQVRGLNQAIRNANDGISVLQVADGAYAEVESMLQRMRELAVQTLSDSYTDEQRAYAHSEFAQLRSQIISVGENTRFNGDALLDGEYSTDGTLTFQIGAEAGQSTDVTLTTVSGTGLGEITGVAGGGGAAAEFVDYDVSEVGAAGTYDLQITANGTVYNLNVTTADDGNGNFHVTAINTINGTAVVANSATVTPANSTDSGTLTFDIEADSLTDADANTYDSLRITTTSTGTGILDSSSATYSNGEADGIAARLSGESIATVTDASDALAALDLALTDIQSARATAGASMNRLTYAVDVLSAESTNMSASLSRVQDADYATATTELARTQIIQQAGTAMLAQANQLPQTVLSLLQ